MDTNKSEAELLYDQLNAKLKRAAAATEKEKLATGEYIKVGDRVQPNPDHENYRGQFDDYDDDENSAHLDRIEATLDRLTKLVDAQNNKLDVVIETLDNDKNAKN